MPPAALTTVYTSRADVEDLLSVIAVNLRVDDNASGIITSDEEARVTRSTYVGTAFVNRYCIQRYEEAQLATSWSVWHWATVRAAFWLCCRRGNPIPGSLAQLMKETVDELKEVAARRMPVDDLGDRNIMQAAWSNVRLDGRYSVRQLRFQRALSDRTPRLLPSDKIDYLGDLITEPPH